MNNNVSISYSTIRPLVVYFLLPIVIIIAFYFPYLSMNFTIHLFQDSVGFLMPIDNYIFRHLDEIKTPYLDPIRMPWHNHMLNMINYPFYYVFEPMFDDFGLNIEGHKLLVLFHLYVHFVGVLFVCKTYKLPIAFAFFAAISATFSYHLFGWSHWPHALIGLSWLPMSWACLHSIFLAEKGHDRFYYLLSFCLGMIGLSSPFSGLFAGVLFFSYVSIFIVNRRLSGRIALKLGLVVILSLLISSPKTFMIIRDSEVFIRWYNTLGGETGSVFGLESIPFDAMLINQRNPMELVMSLLFPVAEDSFEFSRAAHLGSEFVGFIVVYFFLLYLFFCTKSRIDYFLITWTFIFLALGTGNTLKLYELIRFIPYVNDIRYPVFYFYGFVLFVSFYSAKGLYYLIRLREYSTSFVSTSILYFSCCVVLLVVGAEEYEVPVIPVVLTMLMFFISIVLLAVSKRRPQKIYVAVVSVLMIVTMQAKEDHKYTPSGKSLFYKDHMQNTHSILKYLTENDGGIFSVAFDYPNRSQMGSQCLYFDVGSLNYYVSPQLWDNFNTFANKTEIPYYAQFYGAKYLLSNKKDVSSYFKNSKFVRRFGDINLFQTDQFNPDIKLYHNVREHTNDFRVQSDFVDFLWLPMNSKVLTYYNWERDENTIISDIQYLEGEKVGGKRVLCTTSHDAVGVLNRPYDKNWKILVDGEPRATYKVNGNQIGFILSKGTSLVELDYRDYMYEVLSFLSSMSIVVLLFVCVLREFLILR